MLATHPALEETAFVALTQVAAVFVLLETMLAVLPAFFRTTLVAFTCLTAPGVTLEAVGTVHGASDLAAFFTFARFTSVFVPLASVLALIPAPQWTTSIVALADLTVPLVAPEAVLAKHGTSDVATFVTLADFTAVFVHPEPVFAVHVARRFWTRDFGSRLDTSTNVTTLIVLLKAVFAEHRTLNRAAFFTLAQLTAVRVSLETVFAIHITRGC